MKTIPLKIKYTIHIVLIIILFLYSTSTIIISAEENNDFDQYYNIFSENVQATEHN